MADPEVEALNDSIDTFQDVLQEETQNLGETMEGSAEKIEQTVTEAQETAASEIAVFSSLEQQVGEELQGVSNQIIEDLQTVFGQADEQLQALAESSEISDEAFEEIASEFDRLKTKVAEVQAGIAEGTTSLAEAEKELEGATETLQENVESVFSEENFEDVEELTSLFNQSAENISEAAQAGGGGAQAAAAAGPGALERSLAVGLEGGAGGTELFTRAAPGRAQQIGQSFSKISAAATTTTGILAGGFAAALGTGVDLLEDARDAQQEFREQTGASVERQKEIRDLTRQTSQQLAEFGLSPAATTDITSQLREDFGSIGTATSVIGEDLQTVVGQSGAIAEGFGVSAERATQIRTQTEQLENQIGGSAEGTIAFTQNLARANDVAPQAAIRQITENADQLAKFSGKLGPNLGEAAVQAQRLGTSLGSVTQFQEQTLTNVTGQIQEIQKANQLVGNQLNAQRLLQASYEGSGAALEEVRSQLEGIDFESLDFFQRQRLAEALPGFSQQELANIAEAQNQLEGISGETGKIAEKIEEGDLTLQQALTGENVDAFAQVGQDLDALYFQFAQQLAPAIEDLAVAVIPLLQGAITILTPIIQGLANTIGTVTGALSTLATALSAPASKSVTVKDAFDALKQTFFSLVSPVTNIIEKGFTLESVLGSLGQLAGMAIGAFAGWYILTSVSTWISAAASSATVFGVALSSILGPVTAVAATVAGLVALYRNWGTVTETVASLTGSLGTMLSNLGSSILNSVVEGFNNLISYVQNNWQDVLIGAITTALFGLPGLIASYFVPDWEVLKPKLQGVLSDVMSYFPQSPAEAGPLSNLGEVDLGGEIAKTIDPAPVMNAVDSVAGVISTGLSETADFLGFGGGEEGGQQQTGGQETQAQQVQAQPVQQDVATVDQQTPTQQQQQQEAATQDTSNIEGLLQDLLRAQQNLNQALSEGDIGVNLDGRKVNKEMTRDVRNLG